jgi:ketosteroid isomerase-like protein
MTSARDTFGAAVLVVSLILGVACAPGVEDDGGRAELERTIADFYAAIESDDREGHAGVFTETALMLPNNGTPIRGKEDISAVILGGEGWVFRIRNLARAELDLSGDIAYTVNEYEYTWHQENAEPVWHPTKNVHIWRRQPDGKWKLHVDLWNSNEQ